MRVVADLHVHSPFARACSKGITLDNLVKYARLKGVSLLGTGDFTHPGWFSQLKEQLVPAEPRIVVAAGRTAGEQEKGQRQVHGALSARSGTAVARSRRR